ncbi:MAG: hypothetical protein AB4911_03285 [Oscillochloridaceae bacterium umkhey_bin13]
MLTALGLRSGWAWLVSLTMLALALQSPLGATFAAADTYLLPAGVVVPSDLYVVANEVIIEGEV